MSHPTQFSRQVPIVAMLAMIGIASTTTGYAQNTQTQPGDNAAAQPPSATRLAQEEAIETIVVTATKRRQSQKDVPLAVTALSSEKLVASGVVGIDDYAGMVPNLSFGYGGIGRQTARLIQIRGIAGVSVSSGEDTSAMYIGETSIPTSVNPRVVDLDRIEVLRGPQGTLFGARSMGGVVRMVPASPSTSKFFGKVHAGFGSIKNGSTDTTVDATLNVPLSDQAALRVTGYSLNQGGFINRLVDPDASMLIQKTAGAATRMSGDEYLHKNVNNDRTEGVMASLRFDATDWLTITPRVMYQKTESDGPPYVDNKVDNLTKIRQFDLNEVGKDEWTLANLEISARVGTGEIVSSTSYFDRSTLDVEDASLLFASMLGGRVLAALASPTYATMLIPKEKRMAQELRYLSDAKGQMNYIVGAFYQKIDRTFSFPKDSRFSVGAPFIGIAGIEAGDSFFNQDTTYKQTEFALFSEVNYKIMPTLTLTVGARAYDIKTESTRVEGGVLYSKLYGFAVPPFAGKQKETGINPRLAASWEQSREITLYANASKGSRPGGVNTTKGACGALGKNVPETVEADSLWNYEGGIKGNLLGGRLQTNVAAFYIEWKNRQTITIDCSLGFLARTNVGAATSQGFEFDASFKVNDNVSFSGALGYTDAKISDIGNITGIGNNSVVKVGDRLSNTPRVNAAFMLDVSQPLSNGMTGYGHLDVRYVGKSISVQKNDRPEYGIIDARIGTKWDKWDLSLYVKNLLDKRANLSDAPELTDNLDLIAIERPRTLGIDLRARF